MSADESASVVKAALSSYRRAATPADRVDAARRIREAAEALELEAIETARAAGTTWAEIGRSYGLTKQGTQQRFRGRVAGEDMSQPAKKAKQGRISSAKD